MRVLVASKIALEFASLAAVRTVSSLVVYQKVIFVKVVEERITGLLYRSMFIERTDVYFYGIQNRLMG